MNRIKQMVRAQGYKLTPQRRATLDVILQNREKHMSAEEVFLEVKKICPEIGLATVYRTIVLLEEIQILQKHNFDDGRNRYELNDPDKSHHHLICHRCGRVIEVEGDLLEKLECKIQEKYNFHIEGHKVQFTGHCFNCN